MHKFTLSWSVSCWVVWRNNPKVRCVNIHNKNKFSHNGFILAHFQWTLISVVWINLERFRIFGRIPYWSLMPPLWKSQRFSCRCFDWWENSTSLQLEFVSHANATQWRYETTSLKITYKTFPIVLLLILVITIVYRRKWNGLHAMLREISSHPIA